MGTYSKKGFLLPKRDLNILIDVLKNYGRIIAPVQGEKWLRMENIDRITDISFSGLSWYSFKKEVFPQKQIIFEFNGTSIIKPKKSEIDKKVLFGLRMCDLNSFKINDKLFLEQEPPHENYKNNREKITLVGLWCNSQVDNYCFCSSFDLEHYYDICLFDVGNRDERGECFHIKANSEKGEEILFKLNQINGILPLEDYEPQVPDCRTKLNETNIERFFDRNDVWAKESEKCLSCGDCTSLCPTCLCFDIKDKVNLDLVSGVRVAQWDSCMFKDFTAVAGGGIARDKRVDRLKHRIFHKLTYFPKKFDGASMCTGCGRCIRGCPTKIHWVSGINGLVREEQKGGNK